MEDLGLESSSPSIIEIILSWLTPTILFMFLNLVIGTIVITSKAMDQQRRDRDAPAAAAATAAAVDDRPKLSRTSSAFVLERLRSLSLYRSGEIPVQTINPLPPPPSKAEIEETVQIEDQLRKSTSAKQEVVRRSATARVVRREEEEEEKEVDARADDFINRFRHQLRLQRMESLTEYEEMLNSGK
ncbi:hypothetical protein J5N97_003840 [Dioscorea zingiberensis]|uniref:DUF4408 domain-containing protein n=1 Tax=Dioscorea zingiberensis TaxID=325984 RepID=A0A9D5D682_9LILI|nr:hypothetical protein J5N97_003840 [Dioscorea zingiberensis]